MLQCRLPCSCRIHRLTIEGRRTVARGGRSAFLQSNAAHIRLTWCLPGGRYRSALCSLGMLFGSLGEVHAGCAKPIATTRSWHGIEKKGDLPLASQPAYALPLSLACGVPRPGRPSPVWPIVHDSGPMLGPYSLPGPHQYSEFIASSSGRIAGCCIQSESWFTPSSQPSCSKLEKKGSTGRMAKPQTHRPADRV